jgi:hypothetical protein
VPLYTLFRVKACIRAVASLQVDKSIPHYYYWLKSVSCERYTLSHEGGRFKGDRFTLIQITLPDYGGKRDVARVYLSSGAANYPVMMEVV